MLNMLQNKITSHLFMLKLALIKLSSNQEFKLRRVLTQKYFR